MLRASVTAGESGPLIVLRGEADLTNAAELGELVTGQLANGTLHLTVDVAGLEPNRCWTATHGQPRMAANLQHAGQRLSLADGWDLAGISGTGLWLG